MPVEARHVCLLFRRFVSFGDDVTRAYVDALEARGIPHLLVGGRAFHEREEVETLRAALAAIEWPDDELSVFATLRGPLFAIGDEELLAYRHAARRAAFTRSERAPTSCPTRARSRSPTRCGCSRELHQRRNRRPVADTIARAARGDPRARGLRAPARRRAGARQRAARGRARAAVRAVAAASRSAASSTSCATAAEDGQAAEAPIVEEGSDGVRLMTVHKAKGLEFPVVILADITAKLAPAEASRHLDATRGLCALRIGGWSPRELLLQQPIEQAREREEGVRVAYVAATRARDLLVVPAVGDEQYEGGWVGAARSRDLPAARSRRRRRCRRAGCPPFSRTRC